MVIVAHVKWFVPFNTLLTTPSLQTEIFLILPLESNLTMHQFKVLLQAVAFSSALFVAVSAYGDHTHDDLDIRSEWMEEPLYKPGLNRRADLEEIYGLLETRSDLEEIYYSLLETRGHSDDEHLAYGESSAAAQHGRSHGYKANGSCPKCKSKVNDYIEKEIKCKCGTKLVYDRYYHNWVKKGTETKDLHKANWDAQKPTMGQTVYGQCPSCGTGGIQGDDVNGATCHGCGAQLRHSNSQHNFVLKSGKGGSAKKSDSKKKHRS